MPLPVAFAFPALDRLRAALHPLDAAPAAAAWNLDEIADLVPDAAQLREAVVLLGVVPRPQGLQVLLTRRTDSLRQHAGQVSFPGGRVDDDDAGPVAAAVREAAEEIGLAPTQAEPLGFLDPLVTITGFRVLPVVATLASDFVPVANPHEVAEVFEIDLDFLLHPDHLERIALDWRGRTRHVLQYRTSPQAPQQRIWGATASILFNLRERLASVAMEASR